MGCRGTAGAGGLGMNGGAVGTWALSPPQRGGQEFATQRAGLGSSQFPPSVVCRLPAGPWYERPAGRSGGKLVSMNLLPDSSAIRQRVSRTLSRPPSSSAFDLPNRSGPRLRRGGASAALDENPAGLIASGDPLPEQEIGRCCGSRKPHRAWIQRPSSRGSCGSPWAGAPERRPCLHHPPVQAADGKRWATEEFLPGHRNPAEAKIRKPGWTWPGGDQCLSGQSSALQKILRTFFGQCDMALLLIHRARSFASIGPTGSPAPVLGARCCPQLAHPGFRPRFARFAALPCASFFATVEAVPPAGRLRVFEELLSKRSDPSLVLESPDPWRTCQGWPTQGPFSDRAGEGGPAVEWKPHPRQPIHLEAALPRGAHQAGGA